MYIKHSQRLWTQSETILTNNGCDQKKNNKIKLTSILELFLMLSPFGCRDRYPLSWCRKSCSGFCYPLTLQNRLSEYSLIKTSKWHVITYNITFQALVSPLGLTFQFDFMSFELHKVFELFVTWYTLKTSDFLMFPFVCTQVSTVIHRVIAVFFLTVPNHSTVFQNMLV